MNKRDYKIWWTGKDWCLSRKWGDENGTGWCSVAKAGWRWPLRIAARVDAWQFRRSMKKHGITEEFSA